MKLKILDVLQCPRCSGQLSATCCGGREGDSQRTLTCAKNKEHIYEIQDGIIRFATGFDHDAVKREIEYENSTYNGSDRLRDAKLIAQFPETLSELWPHTCNFGPDFKVLIDQLKLKPGAWVLDIGTGPCWSSRLLAQRGVNVIALDVNEANFYGLKTSDILFRTSYVYFERILESMTNLPFQNASLDAITFNASFHHTPDMDKTLRECYRVLKPGGMIAMVNEEFASLRHRIFPLEKLPTPAPITPLLTLILKKRSAKRNFNPIFCRPSRSGETQGETSGAMEPFPIASSRNFHVAQTIKLGADHFAKTSSHRTRTYKLHPRHAQA